MDGTVKQDGKTGAKVKGQAKAGQTAEEKADEELLQEACERYAEWLEAWEENRRNYLEDMKFATSADQWDEQVKNARGKDRPTLTINKLNAITKQIIGDYLRNEIGIKVRPVDSKADVKKAKTRDGIIRNIQDVSRAQDAYKTSLTCSVRGGYGFIKVDTDYANDDDFDLDIRIRRVTNPLSIVPDPFYTEVTGADMRGCFETEMMPKAEFAKKYKKAKPQNWDAVAGKENAEGWYTEKSVRIANYWRVEIKEKTIALLDTGEQVVIESDEYRDKLLESGKEIVKERQAQIRKIRCYKLCGHEILERYDFPGRYIPIIIVAGEEVDIEGKRLFRSSIYYSKDPQRMTNYWKTAATETVALQPKTPWKATARQVQGYESIWATANTGRHQVLYYNHDQNAPPPQREPPPAFAAAEINMALASADDIKATSGVYDASLGARSNETSGKAILARQREGDNATFIFIDNIARAIQQVGTVINDMIPHVYDAQRTLRLLGVDGSTEIIEVNKPELDPVTLETVVINDLAEGKYDVTVTTGPAFATQRAEAAESMMEFVRVVPAAGAVIGDLVAKNMDWPGAEEISERLKRAMPPHITTDPESPEGKAAAQAAQAKQVEAEQTQNALLAGKIEAENAKSEATIAKAQADIVKAEADLIEAVQDTRSQGMQQIIQPPATRAQPAAPVSIVFNTDDASGGLAQTIQGMAADHAVRATSQMEVLGQIAFAIGQLAEVMAGTQEANAMQAAAIGMIAEEAADSNRAVAGAVASLSQVMAAPRENTAIRDAEGKIVGGVSRIVVR